MNISDQLSDHFRLQAQQEKALRKLGIETIEDLFYHFPRYYGDTAATKKIS